MCEAPKLRASARIPGSDGFFRVLYRLRLRAPNGTAVMVPTISCTQALPCASRAWKIGMKFKPRAFGAS